MTTLGQAWIEVHADTKPFAKELAPELRKILNETERLVNRQSVEVGSSISKGVADGIDKDSNRVKASFRKVGDGLKKETKSWEKALLAPFERMTRGNFIVTRVFGSLFTGGARLIKLFGRVGSAVMDLGQALFQTGKLGALTLARAGEVITGVGKDATLTTSKMAATAAQAAASFAAFAAEAAAAGPALAAVVAVVVALSAALAVLISVLLVALAPFAGLVQLAFLLPAAFTVLAAVVAPLIIAFHDLSDAMSLVFEKDPKKLKEGLAQLSPALQGLVKLLRGFSDEFKLLGNSVQEAFFRPIIKELGPALKELMPTLTYGFSRIASAVGVMVADFLKFLSKKSTMDAITLAFEQIAVFLENNSGLLTELLKALGAAAVAALPTVIKLVELFSQFLTEFGTWIEGAITDGRFQKWLDEGIADLTSIWNLVKEILGLFKDLFSNLQGDGRKFLDTITSAIKQFRDWAKSPEGKASLEAMGKLAVKIAEQFKKALYVVEQILASVGRIYSLWKKISGLISGGEEKGVGKAGFVSSYSGGGVVPQDQMAMVHAGEPILDPSNSVAKNKSILADAGMLDVLSEPTVVNVYLGGEKLNERIDYRIGLNKSNAARNLTAGTRS